MSEWGECCIGIIFWTKSSAHRIRQAIVAESGKNCIAENGKNKVVVIAGVGVKQYYIKKLGYRKEGVYVSKKL